MRASLKAEFGQQRPRAVVLDDSARARLSTARRLRSRGFEVEEYSSVADFRGGWKPGFADVIIADWNLSADDSESGDHILEQVRQKDWDVAFVLVSGRLEEDGERAGVLARLLDSGGARFVTRGSGGIARACDEAEDLIERRDLALLRVILSLRPAAMAGQTITTTTGAQPVADLLAETVSKPGVSHDVERPVAAATAERRKKLLAKTRKR